MQISALWNIVFFKIVNFYKPLGLYVKFNGLFGNCLYIYIYILAFQA